MRDEAAAPPSRFEILPLGSPSQELLERIARGLSRRVSAPVHLHPTAADFPLPLIRGREQVHADEVLKALEAHPRAEGAWLLGVTDRDIGHPIFTFFFGRARHHGGAALISTARLEQTFYGLPDDPALTARRAVMEAIHELGHVAGLGHCEDMRCIMRFCTSVEVADNRGRLFCASCGIGVPEAFRRLVPSER